MCRVGSWIVVILLLIALAPAAASAQATGAISGTVTDAATAAPLANINVRVFLPAVGTVGSTSTDASGTYTVGGLAPGTYYVWTQSISPYFDELFDNVPCLMGACLKTDGAPVVVTAGQTRAGVDFALQIGGRITGIVTDADTGAPLAGITVKAMADYFERTATTDATGTYLLGGIWTGTYYVWTSVSHPYLDELYRELPCAGNDCSWKTGTPVNVMSGEETPHINFTLVHGGTITGTVTDSITGLPLEGITVVIGSPSGGGGQAITGASGVYAVSGLTTGTYYARTSYSFPYADELYDNLPCQDGNCSITTGTPISVSEGRTTAGINFALTGGGTITGTVTDAASGAPLPNARVSAYTLDGTVVGYGGSTDASGAYAVSGLQTGTYHLRTRQAFPYLDEVYNDLSCPDGDCPIASGTPVNVTAGSTTGGINFALTRGGSIAGAVTAAATGAPLAGVGIVCYDSTGLQAGLATTDAAGSYTVQGLATGTYYARALANAPYAGELYNELPCPAPGCTVTSGTAITVTAGSTRSGVNFSLALTGGIAGTVTSRETGAPIANAGIGVFTATGQSAGSGSTDAAGVYTVIGLAPGTYYVRAGKTPDFRGALYDNKPCHPDCDITTGTGVVVSSEATTPNIHFALDRSGVVAGTVRNNMGAPVAGVVVMVFNATGAAGGQSVTDASGSYSIPFLEPGIYYVRTSDALPYLGELYNGKPCSPSCLVTSGTPVTVSLNHTTSGIDFGLSISGSIAGTVRQGVAGPPLADVQVAVFSANGTWAGSSTTDAFGTYAVSGLAPGTWYVRASRGMPFLDQMYDRRSCMGADCVPANGTGVTVTSGAVTGGIDFNLRTAARSDIDGNLKSDILWRHANGGDIWLWTMDGTTRLSESHVRTVADTNWEVRALGDVDTTMTADLLWRNKVSGEIYVWPMNGAAPSAELYVGTVDPAYDIVGMGDFNGDGKADFLWRHTTTGDVWIWLMDSQVPTSKTFVDRVDPGYVVKGVGDLDGDNRADIVWHHATRGEVWVWRMNGTTRLDQVWVGTVPDTGYQIEGVADFTGDGRAEIVWRHATRGEVWIWTMNGTAREAETWVATVPDTTYQIAGTGDYDGDGKADLLWRNAVNGEVWVWLMNGPIKLSETWVATVPDVGYQIIR